jgi:hypothetical protein
MPLDRLKIPAPNHSRRAFHVLPSPEADMYDKTTLTFETYETESHGYRQTHVVIRRMYLEDTASHLEGAIDNKAGYGTLEAAKGQELRFRRMLEAGHRSFFDSCTSGLLVHVRWQHYRGSDGTLDYCEPAYDELGRTLGQIEEGLRFLKMIGRKIERAKARRRSELAMHPSDVRPVSNHTFGCPEDLLEALGRAKGFVQIRRDFDGWVLTEVKTVPANAA